MLIDLLFLIFYVSTMKYHRLILELFLILLVFDGTNLWGNILFASERRGLDTIARNDTTGISKEIEEITIAAFRTPYRWIDIPAPVNYISGIQMQTGNAFTPVEAINRVPGIIMHHGTFNTNRLTIRGIGSRSLYATNKIKAYFGEIPLTSGDGETTLEDIETASVGKVEIIKGPSSSLYGAGLGGTILFYPAAVTNSFIKNESTIASFRIFKNTTSVALDLNNTSLLILYSNLSGDGFRDNNVTNRDNFFLHSRIGDTKKVTGDILMRLTKMKAYIPSSLDKTTFETEPQQAAVNWKAVKGYENYTTGQFGASVIIKGQKPMNVKFSLFGRFKNADELRPFNKLEELSQMIGVRGSYQKIFYYNQWQFNMVSGIEVFREEYNWETFSNDFSGDNLSDNREKRGYENIFFQAECSRNKRFILSTGINYNSTRYKYTDLFWEDGDQSGEYTYDPVLSQRIGVNYKIVSATALFMNASHGFSPPTLAETLLPDGELNPDIKPEQGWNFEAGFRGSFRKRFAFEVSYYRIYVSDLLVARRTGEDAYVGVNAGQSVHPGLEAAIKFLLTEPGNWPLFSLQGNTTIANYHFSDFTDDDINYSGKLLPGTSRVLFFTGANLQPAQNFTLNLAYRFTGRMPVNDANTIYSKAYGITTFEAGYQPKIKRISFELKAGVNNLFDEKYAAMLAINAPSFGGNPPRYYYPGNPRNFFVTATIGLKK